MKNIKNKYIKITVLVLLIFVTAISYYAHTIFSNISKVEFDLTDEELGISNETDENEVDDSDNLNKDVVNIALFGVDRIVDGGKPRSDSIIIVSINKKTNEVKITSVMRDLYVAIPDHVNNRINVAYAMGGPKLAIKTLNTNFGLNIRNYATVNFQGVVDLVEILGGIEIDVKPYEKKALKVASSGLQKLNGEQVLAYTRIRHAGNGDFERTQRQRYVLDLVFKKIKAQGIVKLNKTISSALPYIETSIGNTEILSLALCVFNSDIASLEQFRIPADKTYENKTINSMQVLVPDIDENKRLLTEFIYGINNN